MSRDCESTKNSREKGRVMVNGLCEGNLGSFDTGGLQRGIRFGIQIFK